MASTVCLTVAEGCPGHEIVDDIHQVLGEIGPINGPRFCVPDAFQAAED